MCDKTSGIHGIGKGLALKKIMRDAEFQKQDEVFNNEDVTKSDIIAIGEKALVLLYNAGLKSGYSRFFNGDLVYTSRTSPSDFCSRNQPQPPGSPPGTAMARCCAPATRLGLETSRWKSPTRKN